MDENKRAFIEFLFANGLMVTDDPSKDRSLKSKRISPWFLNIGDFNDGATLDRLSEAYAQEIIHSGVKADSVYGIPEKGVSLVGPVSVAMAREGHNIGWFFTRKMPKEHGEATGKTDISKQIVGRIPQAGQSVIQLDDVFTAGDAKYQAREDLARIGEFQLPLLAIALNRQEVGIDGRNAIEEYEKRTGTKVVSVVKAVDVLDCLKDETIAVRGLEGLQRTRAMVRLANYLSIYGTDESRVYAQSFLREMQQNSISRDIIARDKSVIPACDVETLEQFEELVRQTADVPGIGGYKIGFELGYGYGLPRVVEAARGHTQKPLILDHQKAGTDIPDTGRNFARVCKKAGIDAVIFFPQAGPETERAWIYHALDAGLNVLVGGRMTHPAYAVSEGGFITDEGASDMYRIAARAGVRNFVVPGNKPDVIKTVREVVEAEGVSPIFYAPGFIAQGGKIEDAARVAGERFHGIVGRGIYQAKDMRAAAVEHTSQL
jgi:orotidine-5'-phosphate decarboxylase